MRKTLLQTLLAAFCAVLATAPLEGGGVMLINMRNAMLSGGKRTPTAKDYVQDGLVAMWDGIENAGWGVHDPNATTWKDLVGGVHATPNTTMWHVDEKAFVAERSSLPFFIIPESFGDAYLNTENYTIECTITPSQTASASSCFFGNRGNGKATLYYVSRGGSGNLIFTAYYGYDWVTSLAVENGKLNTAAVCSSATGTSLYLNATVGDSNNKKYNPKGGRWGIGGTWNNASFNGEYHCFRVYSRALTAAEIAANYAIDKERFNLPDA